MPPQKVRVGKHIKATKSRALPLFLVSAVGLPIQHPHRISKLVCRATLFSFFLGHVVVGWWGLNAKGLAAFITPLPSRRVRLLQLRSYGRGLLRGSDFPFPAISPFRDAALLSGFLVQGKTSGLQPFGPKNCAVFRPFGRRHASARGVGSDHRVRAS